jgi:D-arabinose 1-dehydrogenase-like Zn-dependent alcohol dehydrogenase
MAATPLIESRDDDVKSAFITGINQPIEIRDVHVPGPGPDQVRIRVRASGVCGTDVHYWNGTLPITFPSVLGHEPVGEIDCVGPGVTTLKPGDRVGVPWVQAGCGRCGYCQQRRINFCSNQHTWMSLGGGHSEFMIANSQGCVLLPIALPYEIAAPMFCAGYTAMSGYRNAKPCPGDRIAVIGIGGLGHLAIQIAKARGHEVIAITSSKNKVAEARDLGADEVLLVQDHAGRELMEMGGVDIVLSTSNSMRLNSEVLSGIRPEGRFVSMAIAKEPICADPLLILDRQIAIIGSQQSGREDMVEILQLAADGKVHPKLEVYTLDEINAVMKRLAENQVRYRSVLNFQ